ncbi:uncharacterized protein BO95DRAFT_479678, partial [Aspergillus brunneoviolaceus CBS 621.78]
PLLRCHCNKGIPSASLSPLSFFFFSSSSPSLPSLPQTALFLLHKSLCPSVALHSHASGPIPSSALVPSVTFPSQCISVPYLCCQSPPLFIHHPPPPWYWLRSLDYC